MKGNATCRIWVVCLRSKWTWRLQIWYAGWP